MHDDIDNIDRCIKLGNSFHKLMLFVLRSPTLNKDYYELSFSVYCPRHIDSTNGRLYEFGPAFPGEKSDSLQVCLAGKAHRDMMKRMCISANFASIIATLVIM